MASLPVLLCISSTLEKERNPRVGFEPKSRKYVDEIHTENAY
jgi:hypothetical protein